jgi:hypothetical protein
MQGQKRHLLRWMLEVGFAGSRSVRVSRSLPSKRSCAHVCCPSQNTGKRTRQDDPHAAPR